MCWFADWVTFLSARCKYKIFLLHSFFEVHYFNPWIAELNPIWHLLALLGAHHILHISRIRVNQLQAARLFFFLRITVAKPVKKICRFIWDKYPLLYPLSILFYSIFLPCLILLRPICSVWSLRSRNFFKTKSKFSVLPPTERNASHYEDKMLTLFILEIV